MKRAGLRQQLSVRLRERDKASFCEAAERCGFEPSVAVRAILELVIQRLAVGGDFIDALHELKTAWQVPHNCAAIRAAIPTQSSRE